MTGTGSTSSQGNVELCIYNQYYPICGNVWTSTEATVACRKLGYNSGLYLYIVGTDNSFWLRRKQMSIAMVQQQKNICSFRCSNNFNSSVFGPFTTTQRWNSLSRACSGTETSLYVCYWYLSNNTCTSARPGAVYCSDPCKDMRDVYAMCICSSHVCHSLTFESVGFD